MLAVSMCSTCHDLSLWFLRLMARLSPMVVLVVLAFLIEATSAHRKLRLAPATLRSSCAAMVLLFADLPRIGNIRLFFKDTQLLLVRLLSLQGSLSRTAIPILLRGATTPIPDLCF